LQSKDATDPKSAEMIFRFRQLATLQQLSAVSCMALSGWAEAVPWPLIKEDIYEHYSPENHQCNAAA
jgi:hypothetical protein